jgi:hypothetical protein
MGDINIIGLTKGDKWLPFGTEKDLGGECQEGWNLARVNLISHLFRKTFGFRLEDCDSFLPSDDKRPVDKPYLALFHGCLFDLDLYHKGIPYLRTEIKSIPDHVFVGFVSKTNDPPEEKINYFKFPIKMENKHWAIPVYLALVVASLGTSLDPEGFGIAVKALLEKVIAGYGKPPG